MSNKLPTYIIFLWHMHQPFYKIPQSNYYLLPWTRLHAVKDYYGMAKILEKFDKVKVAFNFSGVLLEQLLDYIENKTKDYYLILTLKDPRYLKKEERNFIIERFFSVNFERFIKPNQRYFWLYKKKLSYPVKFSPQEILDLQVLFNLCWFHPYTIKEDKNLENIILKEKNYSYDDKDYVVKKQYEIMCKIFPLYKKLLTNKRIEITVSPYYHPIMPLIYDTDILNEFPYLMRPNVRFSSPQDCVWHLKEAKNIFEQCFNIIPLGSWPSEGSVSEDILTLYKQEGFNWLATDEAILFKSLVSGNVSYDLIKSKRHLIYRPYRFNDLSIFFRDRNFSDMISFYYYSWQNSSLAADDLLEHFKKTHSYIKEILKERAITIIMDGENAWDYYPNNGVDFLEKVYKELENNNEISSITPCEFLKYKSEKNLIRLASGSWINGDFGVWIGSKENNKYWSILKKIKDLIEKENLKENYQKIEKYLYILEGSDWFWWNTFKDSRGDFKNIFYSYIENIYKILGKRF